jgi:hypothetical protein
MGPLGYRVLRARNLGRRIGNRDGLRAPKHGEQEGKNNIVFLGTRARIGTMLIKGDSSSYINGISRGYGVLVCNSKESGTPVGSSQE